MWLRIRDYDVVISIQLKQDLFILIHVYLFNLINTISIEVNIRCYLIEPVNLDKKIL